MGDDGLGQSEGDQAVAGRRRRSTATTGNDDILPALYLIGAGRGMPASRERRFPEQGTGLRIESANAIVHGGRDKKESGCGRDRTAVVFRSGLRNAAVG